MFHHICILTDNYNESLKFYLDVLQFELIKETSPFHNRSHNSWLKKDDFYIELMTPNEGDEIINYDKKALGINHFSIYYDNLDKELEHILSTGYDSFKKKNGQIIYQVLGGRLFKLLTPEGTIIEFRDSMGL